MIVIGHDLAKTMLNLHATFSRRDLKNKVKLGGYLNFIVLPVEED